MKNLVVLDCETLIVDNANPFSKFGKLCLVGIKDRDGYHDYDIEYTDSPYGEQLEEIRRRIEQADLLIGFNLKFDLLWILRYVPDIQLPACFDCQLAAFILGNQSSPYPSLDKSLAQYGLPPKLDVVRLEYWANGIDTPDVPEYVIRPYLQRDVEGTYELYERQVCDLDRQPKKRRLFTLQCRDLIELAYMETNGMMFNTEEAKRRGEETTKELAEVDARLRALFPTDGINFGSVQHLSVLLYGGSIPIQYRESYERTLKDGTVKQKERWSERVVEFPRLVQPLRGTEGVLTAKLSAQDLEAANQSRREAGKKSLRRNWSVSEPVLRRLRPKSNKAKQLISLLLTRARLEQLDGLYYTGLVEKLKNWHWELNVIHGQFNQCVVVTSRLSSSKPNLQNFDRDLKALFYSRFA